MAFTPTSAPGVGAYPEEVRITRQPDGTRIVKFHYAVRDGLSVTRAVVTTTDPATVAERKHLTETLIDQMQVPAASGTVAWNAFTGTVGSGDPSTP